MILSHLSLFFLSHAPVCQSWILVRFDQKLMYLSCLCFSIFYPLLHVWLLSVVSYLVFITHTNTHTHTHTHTGESIPFLFLPMELRFRRNPILRESILFQGPRIGFSPRLIQQYKKENRFSFKASESVLNENLFYTPAPCPLIGSLSPNAKQC